MFNLIFFFMITRYLLLAVENDRLRAFNAQPHPHSTRAFVVDDELVCANTFEDTEFDKVSPKVPPTLTERMKSGEHLKPMGSAPHTTGLADAEFAASFVSAFNAAGSRPSPESAPDSSPEPALDSASEPAPEPAKN